MQNIDEIQSLNIIFNKILITINKTTIIQVNLNNTSNTNDSNHVVDFSVGSMPANYGYDESFSKEDDSNESSSQFKPRILIMGLRR